MFSEVNKKYIICSLLVFAELTLLLIASFSYSNKDLDKYVVGIETKLDKNMFKVMLEDQSGGYTESVDNTFPSYDYFFNVNKSGCIDNEGNKLDNSLIFDPSTRKVSINVSKTSYCYLYYDLLKEVTSDPNLAQKLINDGLMWQSGLESDGYRFTGTGNAESSTTPDNFICFGTTDQTECKNNESKYLYRIIGVFEDGEGNKHAKLIKYYSLPSTQVWHSSNTDTNWEDSSLKISLNGSYFATNTAYAYMQNAEWTNKITNWTWSSVNTKTAESSGPNYYDGLSPSNMYLHEMNRSSKTSSVGVWTTPQAKVGLMYLSDYALSLGDTAKNMTTDIFTNRAALKTGWMNISNNAYETTTGEYQYEWTMSRYGNRGSNYYAWSVDSGGYVYYHVASSLLFSVRPSFYLTSDVTYSNGTGDYTDPIIIGEAKRITATNEGANVTATVTPGEYELHKYCINTSQTNLSNCEWKDASTNITDTLSDQGEYYLHVVDKGGYVIHSDKLVFIEVEFNQKNDGQLYTVPTSGRYKIELWGAQGNYVNVGFLEGYGAYTSGEIILQQNTPLYFYIGRSVGNDSSLRYTSMFNGGSVATNVNGSHYAASGGGATDVRLTNGIWNNDASLRSRIMVSGGGGGAWYQQDSNNSKGANAGGLYGYDSVVNVTTSAKIYCAPLGEASQTNGGQRVSTSYTSPYCSNNTSGSFGIGGNACTSGSSPLGGGGGGGYYGGTGGTHASGYCASGGGGGSSFISGHTGCVAVTAEDNQNPKSGCTTGSSDNNCSIHYSGKVFTNTKMIDGAGYVWTNTKGTQEQMPNPEGGYYDLGRGHSGNGYARITYIGKK